MSYQISFEDVLLPGWCAWTGNGISEVPAKNVVLNNKAKGCVLIGSEGICVYKIPHMDLLNTQPLYEEGNAIVAYISTIDHIEKLAHVLSASMLNEIYTVYNKYVERENSFI